MPLTAFRLILVLLAGLFPTPSRACTLTLGSGGTLDLSLDGTLLGSEQGAGEPASLTVLTGLFDKVTISAPTLVSAPGAYQAAGQMMEVAYQGLGGLSGVVHPYTVQTTQFNPGLVPLSILRLHSRIHNSSGFAAGDYRMRVVVTCS